jgi:hypothetical protein
VPREPGRIPGGPSGARASRPDATPETAAQALERARGHARRAVGEALASIRALLDAASLGWSGHPSDAHAALRGLSELLEQQSQRFAQGEGAVPAAILEAILAALDHEIVRWETRGQDDADARAVLRTFLGLREILWEFGLRRQEGGGTPASGRGNRRGRSARPQPGSASASPKTAETAERPRRVQRVDVQG